MPVKSLIAFCLFVLSRTTTTKTNSFFTHWRNDEQTLCGKSVRMIKNKQNEPKKKCDHIQGESNHTNWLNNKLIISTSTRFDVHIYVRMWQQQGTKTTQQQQSSATTSRSRNKTHNFVKCCSGHVEAHLQNIFTCWPANVWPLRLLARQKGSQALLARRRQRR